MDRYHHPNTLCSSLFNRQHIPSSIPTNTLTVTSISSLTPTNPHPDDPSSSSSPPQQSTDTDSPDGPALKQTPPLSEPPSLKPSSGVHRALQSNAARDTLVNLKASKGDRECRKRNRVTPVQLLQLEAAFREDRSPNSTTRRELSNRIEMAERAVQIWFQNRRAKAKHQSPTAVPPTANPPPLSGSPPALRPPGVTREASLTNILNEREDIIIFPVTDIAIGTWRRIHTPPSDRDLVAYWAPQSQRLCWFIHSGGLSFRMDIPFSSVVTVMIQNETPTRIAVHFELNKPPTSLIQQPHSYIQLPSSVRRFPTLGVAAGEWASCRDWTEGNQASKVLKHEVTGPLELLPAIQSLSRVLNLICEPNINLPQPPEPRIDLQPPIPGTSVAINARVDGVSSPRALSHNLSLTYRDVHQPYTNLTGFPQQNNAAMSQPETILHSPILPVEMHQTSASVYPPPYPLIDSQQFTPLVEPAVVPDSANPTGPHMNTHRPTLAQHTYQSQHSGSSINSFSTPLSNAPQGRGDLHHKQALWEPLTNSLFPTVSDSTLMSGFSSAGFANLISSAAIDSLVTRPQHELHSHLQQESPFQTSNVPFFQTPLDTTLDIADWPLNTYPFMDYPPMHYIHPGSIQPGSAPYSVGH